MPLVVFRYAVALSLILISTLPATAGEVLKPITGVKGDLKDYKVVYVTSLADSGAGSLRKIIEDNAKKNPIVVRFNVTGKIPLKSKLPVRNNFGIMIDGTAAPNDGITLENNGISIRTSNVLVQGLRIHVGNRKEGGAGDDRDGIQILGDDREKTPLSNIVIRRNSVEWALDESFSLVSDCSTDILIENNIFAEPLRTSGVHPEKNHNLNFMVGRGAKRVQIYNNLLAGGVFRNPQIGDGADVVVANNVIYNPGNFAVHYVGGTKYARFETDPLTADVFSNVFIAGPDTQESYLMNGKIKQKMMFPYPFSGTALAKGSRIFQAQNTVYFKDGTKAPWQIDLTKIAKGNPDVEIASTYFYSRFPINVRTNDTDIINYVLANVGANSAKNMLDVTDRRVIAEVKARTSRYIDNPPAAEFKK